MSIRVSLRDMFRLTRVDTLRTEEYYREAHLDKPIVLDSLNFFILHRLRNKLSDLINHARCLLPGDLTSKRAVCVDPKVRTPSSRHSNQGPLIRETDALPLHHCLLQCIG